MDAKRNDEHILQSLEMLGIDVCAERLNVEAHHLITLFEQGKTVEEALSTVDDPRLRSQLRPFLYYSTLRALILAATQLQVITPEQFSDLERYLAQRNNAPTLFLQ